MLSPPKAPPGTPACYLAACRLTGRFFYVVTCSGWFCGAMADRSVHSDRSTAPQEHKAVREGAIRVPAGRDAFSHLFGRHDYEDCSDRPIATPPRVS